MKNNIISPDAIKRKHKIIFGTFPDVERQLDDLQGNHDEAESHHPPLLIPKLIDYQSLGIAFVPAMIQGGSKQTAMIPICAILTRQNVIEEESKSE